MVAVDTACGRDVGRNISGLAPGEVDLLSPVPTPVGRVVETAVGLTGG